MSSGSKSLHFYKDTPSIEAHTNSVLQVLPRVVIFNIQQLQDVIKNIEESSEKPVWQSISKFANVRYIPSTYNFYRLKELLQIGFGLVS